MENSGNNTLYPIFLKLNQLSVLIIGGGEVGLEKATFMLKNSPDAGAGAAASRRFHIEIRFKIS